MNNLEVLSPAGSVDSFFCAINNGADAVYLGLSKFNARAKSQDFTPDNIREYVKIAHLFGVKVYITLNTIVTQDELSDLIFLVKKAIDAKVDAFIVQDFGVAKLLKDSFKNIVLHASTQMGIHNLEGALIAKELGFTRVVLSRETTLEDIIEIKKNTNLEIEYFVQGALCVGFSGACYFSSLKHNKSGNRGECLQLCRLCYGAKGKNIDKKGYFLSPSDLCFVDNLQTLVEAGVSSFKIEGRLRRPSYVAVATQEYARAKNMLIAKNSNQLHTENSCFCATEGCVLNNNLSKNNYCRDSKTQLQKVFFRGEYNNGLYLKGEPNLKIINPLYQNHRGVLVGEVINVKPFKDLFEIKVQTTGYQISKNDGLKFVDNAGCETSLGVGSVKLDQKIKNTFYIYSKANPKQKSQVYLTVDSKWEDECLNIKNKLLFDAFFEGKINKHPVLTLSCCDVQIKEILTDTICQEAKTQGLTLEEIASNLQKTQDTFFSLRNVDAKLENIFLPKSQLNELRRRAIDSLFEKIVKNFEQKFSPKVCFDEKVCKKLLNFKVDINKHKKDQNIQDINIDQNSIRDNGKKEDIGQCNINFVVVNEKTLVQDIQNLKLDSLQNLNIVISPSVYTIDAVINLVNYWQSNKVNKIYLDLPRVLSYLNKKHLKAVLDVLPTYVGVVANNIYGLYFCKDREVVGGSSLNIANYLSAQTLKDFGVSNFVRTFEYFAGDFEEGLSFEGKPALMTFCHCPYKTVYKNSECKNCKFDNLLQYISQDGNKYNIRRIRMKSCIFELVDDNKIQSKSKFKFIDLR